ncbi:MAG: protein sip-5 [Luteimonas sp.]
MNFTQLKRQVERGETLVEGRIRQTTECHARLHRNWREAWTPLRIVLAGLATGFIAGRAEPEKALKKLGSISGPRTLQLITSMAGLVGSVQAAITAMTAKNAAETADQAADAAAEADRDPADPGAPAPASPAEPATPTGPAAPPMDDAASSGVGPEATPQGDRRRPDQRWDSQPSPAEAATELSER